MEEVITLITTYGGLVILAAMFIIDWNDTKKRIEIDKQDMKEERENQNLVISELSSSNKNIAESLNLLKNSIDNCSNEVRMHDEKAIQKILEIQNEILKISDKKGE